QGKYPMHLVSSTTIPPEIVAERDEIPCRVFRRHGEQQWLFAPSEERFREAFELEFDLPDQIQLLVRQALTRAEVAGLKRQEFSFLDLTGRIGGIRRNVRLALDNEWLDQMLQARAEG